MVKRKFKVTVDGETFLVEVDEVKEPREASTLAEPSLPRQPVTKAVPSQPVSTESGTVNAPIPGVVSEIRVSQGDRVEDGSVLLVLEAMKMENEVYAPIDGVVSEVYVEAGQQVGLGDRLVKIS